jgi:hypothetical protein
MYLDTSFEDDLLHLDLKKMFKENKIIRKIKNSKRKKEHLFMPNSKEFNWFKDNIGDEN